MYDGVIRTAGMQGEVDTGQSMCREKTDLAEEEEGEEGSRLERDWAIKVMSVLMAEQEMGRAVAVWNSDRFLQHAQCTSDCEECNATSVMLTRTGT